MKELFKLWEESQQELYLHISEKGGHNAQDNFLNYWHNINSVTQIIYKNLMYDVLNKVQYPILIYEILQYICRITQHKQSL